MELVLIGGNGDVFGKYLETSDPCFGKSYARSAPECKECTTPVIIGGKVLLLKDVCRAQTAANVPGRESEGQPAPAATPCCIKRLPYQDILHRVQAGYSAMEIFKDILGEGSFDVEGPIARQYLYDAMYYLRKKYGTVTPDIPKLQDLRPFDLCSPSQKKSS